MKIRFSGEDKGGNPTTFNSWRELAEHELSELSKHGWDEWPLSAKIDPETLSRKQIDFLIAEFRAVLSVVSQGHGQERALHFKTYPQLKGIESFASRNLSILSRHLTGEASPIDDAKFAANEYLNSVGIAGLDAVLQSPKKGQIKWLVNPNPPNAQEYSCIDGSNFFGPHNVRGDTLWGYLITGFLPQYTHIWHSANILAACFDLELAVKNGDIDAAVRWAAMVGMSHGKLQVISAKTSDYRDGATQTHNSKKARNKDRDEWLYSLWKAEYSKNKHSNSEAAVHLERTLNQEISKEGRSWDTLSANTIRKNFIPSWKKADH